MTRMFKIPCRGILQDGFAVCVMMLSVKSSSREMSRVSPNYSQAAPSEKRMAYIFMKTIRQIEERRKNGKLKKDGSPVSLCLFSV